MKPSKLKSTARPTRDSSKPAPPAISGRVSKSEIRNPQTILLAVTGMSPAVLTETVWALARENPPVIPDRIVVITTLLGKGRIEDDLFKVSPDYANRTVWQALRDTVFQHTESHCKNRNLKTENLLILDDIRLISSRDAKLGRSFPLEDIRTPADNETAADFILDEVR